MSKEEYEEALAEAKRLYEDGIFIITEYEAVVKILFDRRFGIKVEPRLPRRRLP